LLYFYKKSIKMLREFIFIFLGNEWENCEGQHKYGPLGDVCIYF